MADNKKHKVNLAESKSFHESIVGIIATILLTIGAIFMLFPLIWMVSTSLKEEQEVMINSSLIPWNWYWKNYIIAWKAIPFGTYLRNSTFITFMSLIGALISNSLVAYGFANFKFKGRNIIFLCVLGTMMIPNMVMMVPTYVLFSKINWVGTYLPLIVPAFTGSAYYIFLLRQGFMGIPRSYAEAAKIEGAGELTIFTKICIPLVRPILTTVAVFEFNNKWNDYFNPMLYLNDESLYTLQLGLRSFRGTAGVEWHKFMAASLIVLLPSVLIYIFLQKYIIKSVAIGGIKG
jgi:multiple sugar transport system permease protein